MRTAIRSALALAAAVALTLVGPQPGTSVATPAGPGDRAAADVRAAGKAIVRPATLRRVEGGYYFGAWGQNSRVVVTLVDGKLRFSDPRTARWQGLARSCERKRVARGVAAVCRVPNGVTPANPLTINFEMRLGDDHVDTSTLPAQFRTSALLDAGVDVARTGAGKDFVNGAFDRDLIISGAGNDWVRSGESGDRVFGGDGRDRVVGGELGDRLRGGDGIDLVEGGPGNDEVYGDAGADRLKCGDGSDAGEVDPADTQRLSCERSLG
ncbi:calcium-binding protein [Nocardioides bizhenqiangii]|uniref:Calcium-binding protein n=1 Tax=Nocardioides bizhenqiangii TaxID=3095076 RepID=A0ABZ0ZNY5_9ACTN|nr:calcium-binding protein [Nocardioides sp. HM61]WQQ26045.1 calcium-binding protein [Nocardioides sp. HM61]